jgi:hypothetical protein
MAIAYSYVRFSTTEQADGDSLLRQTKLSEAYAKKLKFVSDVSLKRKNDGLSSCAPSAQRTLFMQLVNQDTTVVTLADGHNCND